MQSHGATASRPPRRPRLPATAAALLLLLLLALCPPPAASGWGSRTGTYASISSKPERRMMLRYGAYKGLGNQMICHLTALALALQLQTDVMLPPMMFRDAFDRQAEWYFGPSELLFDVSGLRQLLHQHNRSGLRLLPTDWPSVVLSRSQARFTHLGAGYPWDLTPSVKDARLFRRDYAHMLPALPQVVDLLRTRISRQPPNVTALDVGFTFFVAKFNTTADRQLGQDVAKHLEFSPYVRALAARVAAALRKQSGVARVTAVHLRLEPDITIIPGTSVSALWQEYAAAIANTSFGASTAVYIATGLELQALEPYMPFFRQHAIVSVSTKTTVLQPPLLRNLPSELAAAVDFLVAVDADDFVGWSRSTFSFLVWQWRKMRGKPDASTRLLQVDPNHSLYVAYSLF